MRKRSIKIFCISFLTIISYGCTSLHQPEVNLLNCLNYQINIEKFDTTKWALDSLKPSENTTLYRRQIIPVKIYFEAHGDCNYILEITCNKKRLKPFILKMESGSGEIDFYGQISWYIKPKGNRETITIALYSIEETKSGNTEVKTLLKHFIRTYDVKCHKKHQKVN